MLEVEALVEVGVQVLAHAGWKDGVGAIRDVTWPRRSGTYLDR